MTAACDNLETLRVQMQEAGFGSLLSGTATFCPVRDCGKEIRGGDGFLQCAGDHDERAMAGAVVAELNAEAQERDARTDEGGAEGICRSIHVSALVAPLDREDRVADLIGMDSITNIYGPPGCGKTFLALDLAAHIALGREWMGRPVQPAPVLYVAAEAGRSIGFRIAALRSRIPEIDSHPFYALLDPVDLMNDGTDQITAEATRVDAKLIVIDTAAQAAPTIDENSSEMKRLVACLNQIRIETGAEIVVIHHSGKDLSRGARGHNSLKGAVDTEIEVTGGEGVHVARVTKQRDFPDNGEIGFGLEVVELGETPSGKKRTSCVVVACDPEQARAGSRPNKGTGSADLLEAVEWVLASGRGVRPDAAITEAAPTPVRPDMTASRVTDVRKRFEAVRKGRTDTGGQQPDTIARAYRRAVQDLVSAKLLVTYEDFMWCWDFPYEG